MRRTFQSVVSLLQVCTFFLIMSSLINELHLNINRNAATCCCLAHMLGSGSIFSGQSTQHKGGANRPDWVCYCTFSIVLIHDRNKLKDVGTILMDNLLPPAPPLPDTLTIDASVRYQKVLLLSFLFA